MIRNKPYSTKSFGRQIESRGLGLSSSFSFLRVLVSPRKEVWNKITARPVDRVRAARASGNGCEWEATRREKEAHSFGWFGRSTVVGMEGRSAHARLATEQLRAATLSLVCRNPVQIYVQLPCQQCLKSLLVLVALLYTWWSITSTNTASIVLIVRALRFEEVKIACRGHVKEKLSESSRFAIRIAAVATTASSNGFADQSVSTLRTVSLTFRTRTTCGDVWFGKEWRSSCTMTISWDRWKSVIIDALSKISMPSVFS